MASIGLGAGYADPTFTPPAATTTRRDAVLSVEYVKLVGPYYDLITMLSVISGEKFDDHLSPAYIRQGALLVPKGARLPSRTDLILGGDAGTLIPGEGTGTGAESDGDGDGNGDGDGDGDGGGDGGGGGRGTGGGKRKGTGGKDEDEPHIPAGSGPLDIIGPDPSLVQSVGAGAAAPMRRTPTPMPYGPTGSTPRTPTPMPYGPTGSTPRTPTPVPGATATPRGPISGRSVPAPKRPTTRGTDPMPRRAGAMHDMAHADAAPRRTGAMHDMAHANAEIQDDSYGGEEFLPASAPLFQKEGDVGTPFRTVQLGPDPLVEDTAQVINYATFSERHTDGFWHAQMTQSYGLLVARFSDLRIIDISEMADPAATEFFVYFTRLVALRAKFDVMNREKTFATDRATVAHDIATQEEILRRNAEPIIRQRDGPFLGDGRPNPLGPLAWTRVANPAAYTWPRR